MGSPFLNIGTKVDRVQSGGHFGAILDSSREGTSHRQHPSLVSITYAALCKSVHTMAISVASALVSSRLDYANSVLFGCPQKHVARLQRVQHAITRVVTQ